MASARSDVVTVYLERFRNIGNACSMCRPDLIAIRVDRFPYLYSRFGVFLRTRGDIQIPEPREMDLQAGWQVLPLD